MIGILTPLSVRPFPAKDFHGGSGHVNVVVCLRPMQTKIPAAQVNEHASLRSSGKNAGNRDGTGSGAAGQCFARAAFPDAHRDIVRSVYAYKLGIGPSRECGMRLYPGTNTQHELVGELVDKADAVRIPH